MYVYYIPTVEFVYICICGVCIYLGLPIMCSVCLFSEALVTVNCMHKHSQTICWPHAWLSNNDVVQ